MMKPKDETVASNVNGVAYLFKKNKIETFNGVGKIIGPGRIEVAPAQGDKQTIETKNIVSATGSCVTPLPGINIDEKVIISSNGALSLPAAPKKMLIIGAGIIGLELGSVWRRLG